MKIPITMKAAALALAGVVLGTHQSDAATLYTQGDILLGFRLNNNSGVPAYLVDLGPASVLTSLAPGASISFGSISSIGQDLIDTYGANWYTLSNLSVGVFGTDQDNFNTLYASRARQAATPGTPAALWQTQNSGSRQITFNQLANAESGFSNGATTTASGNTTNAGFESSTSQGSYWFGVNPTPDFGSAANWTSIEGSNASGLGSVVLDLQEIGTGPTVDLGKFTIDGTGVVTFTAVPEPSTYALLTLSGVVFVVFLRRRPSLQA